MHGELLRCWSACAWPLILPTPCILDTVSNWLFRLFFSLHVSRPKISNTAKNDIVSVVFKLLKVFSLFLQKSHSTRDDMFPAQNVKSMDDSFVTLF